MAGPGIAAGKRIDKLVYQSGLFPTACELCGLEIPRTVEHRSMASLAKHGRGAGYNAIYGGYLRLQRMIRDEEWKLILYPQAHKTQLFHIQKDPWERVNLADEAKHSGLIVDMKKRLRKLQSELDDTLEIV
jgi:choline-sulfatase